MDLFKLYVSIRSRIRLEFCIRTSTRLEIGSGNPLPGPVGREAQIN